MKHAQQTTTEWGVLAGQVALVNSAHALQASTCKDAPQRLLPQASVWTVHHVLLDRTCMGAQGRLQVVAPSAPHCQHVLPTNTGQVAQGRLLAPAPVAPHYLYVRLANTGRVAPGPRQAPVFLALLTAHAMVVHC